MMTLNRTLAHGTITVSILGLAACAPPPSGPNPALQRAEAQVGTLGQDAGVARYAPQEAERARQYLAQAKASAGSGAGEAVVTHEAYLATQQAEIARQLATAKLTRAEIARTDALRGQALLAAQRREQAEPDRRPELQAMQPRQTARGVVLTLGNTLFQPNSAELVPDAATQLDNLADMLKQDAGSRVEIDGYTDSTGNETQDLGLSQLRAEAVQGALTARGIEPSRVIARGRGDASPVASNETDLGRQMNRRVEVLIARPSLAPEQSSGAVTRPE